MTAKYRCTCGSTEFAVKLTATSDVRFNDDGSFLIVQEGPSELFDGDSPAECSACNTLGRLRDFRNEDDAERNCAHEWNQTAGEADESGFGIRCLKCGQDGDS